MSFLRYCLVCDYLFVLTFALANYAKKQKKTYY